MKTWINRVSHAQTADDVTEITRRFVSRVSMTGTGVVPRSCLPPARLDSIEKLRDYASTLVSFHSREANTAAVYWIAAYFATAAVRLAEILQDTPLI